jgi:hypothetical protein
MLTVRRARTRLTLAGAVGWLLLAGASVALHSRDSGRAAHAPAASAVPCGATAPSAGIYFARPTRSATPAP